MSNALASPSGFLTGFGVVILKHLLEQLLATGEARVEVAVVLNLHHGGHDLPAAPTDQDKEEFVRHATRQFFKVALQSGAIANIGRDFFVPRLAPTVTPQLAAGTSTAKGANLVGTALVADVQGLVGQV